MKVTKAWSVTLLLGITSGLLLFAAASCSVEQERSDAAVDTSTIVDSDMQEQHDADEDSDSAHAVEPEYVTLNTYCYACHGNFDGDKLAMDHQLVGIGCERCHGESERHRSDEENVTPPQIMYPRAKINPTCMMCHPRPTIEHVDHHDVILAGADTIFDEPVESPEDEKVCTDCHGRGHRVNVRTVRWNKATGELIE